MIHEDLRLSFGLSIRRSYVDFEPSWPIDSKFDGTAQLFDLPHLLKWSLRLEQFVIVLPEWQLFIFNSIT